jgi:hypothetical protein
MRVTCLVRLLTRRWWRLIKGTSSIIPTTPRRQTVSLK